MKQSLSFLFSIFFCLLFKLASAQTDTIIATGKKTMTRTYTRTITRRIPLDTNEVIYDEKGNALRYYQSQKLLNTGEYTITMDMVNGVPGTTKRLKKLTVTEQNAAYEHLKAMMAIPGQYLKEGQLLDVAPLLTILNKQEVDQKAIVMIFWSPECPPCTESFSALNDFFTQIYNPERIAILAITTDDKSVAAAKLKQKPLVNAQLLSNARDITSAYDLNSYPAFVVTDKEHIIRLAIRGTGSITINAFKNTIRSVLYQ